ncbi:MULTISPECIES: RT0821/Lpp0805 family surface protein [unclassified Thioalkalivibrio]|jgi:surface antigen|uniref:RT0821/Lpp0805 family surface protein n=1 Tax=unclassified Thioalkalivibrio TaxID=2621013 RepID=UPI000195A3FC|nr:MULTISPECIES: RT0821/Lpp0805 family surface protein [unclassified Thioalkalivibrio]ADC71141.1 17 kDa surface antigen [Thioalkalivibrio sp. K90mix]
MKKTVLLAAVASVAFLLAGCQTPPTKQQTGAVIGGAAGGVIGSQIGGGRGRTAAIIAGTLAGAAIGGSVGRTMDQVDRQQVSHTLEHNPDHRASTWQNPNTGYQYQATPTRTYQAHGQDCREYQVQTTMNGQPETVNGTACRDAQGRWVNQ